jgi:hypothetical protein
LTATGPQPSHSAPSKQGGGAAGGSRERERRLQPQQPGGGRLTPAAELLHREDVPSAQHGALPARCAPAAATPKRSLSVPSHARAAARPAGRGPGTLPAGGGDGVGAGVRVAAGNPLRVDWESFAPPSLPGAKGRTPIRSPWRSTTLLRDRLPARIAATAAQAACLPAAG